MHLPFAKFNSKHAYFSDNKMFLAAAEKQNLSLRSTPPPACLSSQIVCVIIDLRVGHLAQVLTL